MRKINWKTYWQLKKEYKEIYRLYREARKRLHALGEGISEDDIIMEFDFGSP